MQPSTWLILGILAVIIILVFTVRIRTAPKAGENGNACAEPVSFPAAPSAAPAARPVVESGISPQVVAAIMAAIEAASDGAVLRFVAIRRAETVKNGWSSSGTAEQIAARQQYL